jgi:hypothetical protein
MPIHIPALALRVVSEVNLLPFSPFRAASARASSSKTKPFATVVDEIALGRVAIAGLTPD